MKFFVIYTLNKSPATFARPGKRTFRKAAQAHAGRCTARTARNTIGHISPFLSSHHITLHNYALARIYRCKDICLSPYSEDVNIHRSTRGCVCIRGDVFSAWRETVYARANVCVGMRDVIHARDREKEEKERCNRSRRQKTRRRAFICMMELNALLCYQSGHRASPRCPVPKLTDFFGKIFKYLMLKSIIQVFNFDNFMELADNSIVRKCRSIDSSH